MLKKEEKGKKYHKKQMKEMMKKERKNLKLKKEKLRERGITLIALVVTIIILLILAGVTLNMTLSQNGLFSRAQNAADRYKKAQEDEEDLIEQLAKDMETLSVDYSKYIGAIVTGYNPVTKTSYSIGAVTSGIETSQNFSTDTDMQWRIWDYDGRTLRIIGDPTKDTLELKGAAGYNNGVWAIDEICKECYSNNKPGVEVTSLKRSDIQKVSSYDYTQYKHEKATWQEVTDNSKNDSELIYFGESKTYDANNKYPKMWEDNDQSWTYGYNKSDKTKTGSDQECITWENKGKDEGQMGNEMTQGSESTTFKQSYYAHTYKDTEFPNKKYYNLIFKKADGQTSAGLYWLAGRYVLLYGSNCDFGMQRVNAASSRVYGNALCSSYGFTYSGARAVRPIVSINLKSSGCKIEVTEDEENGDIKSCKLTWEN